MSKNDDDGVAPLAFSGPAADSFNPFSMTYAAMVGLDVQQQSDPAVASMDVGVDVGLERTRSVSDVPVRMVDCFLFTCWYLSFFVFKKQKRTRRV